MTQPFLVMTMIAGAMVLMALAAALILQFRRNRAIQERLDQMQQILEERTHQLERATRAIRDESTADELTGIANHRAFQDHLNLQWRRTARSRLPLTVMMLDVDALKKYNESKGQQAGDEVLRQIAIALRNELQRPGDMVARFGGDEFAVLLAETDSAGGLAVAERMRHAVESLQMTWGPSLESQTITISIGVATTVPSPREQPSAILAAADRMVSVAKRNGRNRVEV